MSFNPQKISKLSSLIQSQMVHVSALHRAPPIEWGNRYFKLGGTVLNQAFERSLGLNICEDESLDKLVCKLDLKALWEGILTTPQSIIFFQQAVIQTLKCLQNKKYTQLDAHTTSNCCHGIALTISKCVQISFNWDLESFEEEFSKNILLLQNNLGTLQTLFECLPSEFWALVSAYVLCKAGVLEPIKGRVTCAIELQKVHAAASKKFCLKLIKKLQRNFSQAIAASYSDLSEQLDEGHLISGIDAKQWGQYIQQDYIRCDQRGLHYASCIFSSQVTLAYLASLGYKVAIVSDLISHEGENKGRYIQVLEGNGKTFSPLSQNETASLNKDEPVFILGGYALSDDLTLSSYTHKMSQWLPNIASLILAADTHYPQFPSVGDDQSFNNSPIVPDCDEVKNAIEEHSKVLGVAQEDPSFFFLDHYYVASVHEIMEDSQKKMLPFSPDFTPHSLKLG